LPRQNLATGENDGHKNRELAKWGDKKKLQFSHLIWNGLNESGQKNANPNNCTHFFVEIS
jgi:hypothetical protein